LRGLITASLFASLALSAAEPQRIISTAPSITEILYALGLGNRVAGVTQYCRYPVEAQSKPKIGSFLEPDFERILALKPDLVIVIKNPVQVAEKLRNLGVRAEEVNQDSISDILISITTIGRLTGRNAAAQKLAGSLRAQLDDVRRGAAQHQRRTALFLVGRSPGTLQGMVGAGPRTFVDELIAIAGGINVLKDSPIQYPRVSIEQVLASDPEVILDMGDFAHHEGKPLESADRLHTLWGKYPRLRAVRNKEVRQISSEVFIRPGPRMAEAARQLSALLHADRSK